MKRIGSGCGKGNRGAAIVELALILPLLLALVFGAIEFGWMLRTYQAVGQLAREGARSACLNTSPGDVIDRMDTLATTTYDLDTDNITSRLIEYRTYEQQVDGTWTMTQDWTELTTQALAVADASHYSQIKVSLSYDYPLITGALFSWLSGGSTVPMNQRVVMRKEGQTTVTP